jgi:hypothetical protein
LSSSLLIPNFSNMPIMSLHMFTCGPMPHLRVFLWPKNLVTCNLDNFTCKTHCSTNNVQCL